MFTEQCNLRSDMPLAVLCASPWTFSDSLEILETVKLWTVDFRVVTNSNLIRTAVVIHTALFSCQFHSSFISYLLDGLSRSLRTLFRVSKFYRIEC
jgi:hypothetical protein